MPAIQVVRRTQQPKAVSPNALDAQVRRRAAIRQTHPIYDKWIEDWRELGWLYEGDGPYKDGTALIAHPRELDYPRDADGNVTSYDNPIAETQKYKRRRRIASYENVAEVVIDTVTDHQYAQGIARSASGTAQRRRGDGSISPESNTYFQWLEDVDGLGTHMDDWLHDQQALANLYGHLVVVIDRLPSLTPRPRSKAEQGRQVLRTYIPPDALDWTHSFGRLTSVKVVDPVERRDILDPHFRPLRQSATGNLLQQGGTVEEAEGLEFRIFRADGWELYDAQAKLIDKGPYIYGRAPIDVFYSKRRARIPVIGRSFLKSPTPYRDHYNLLSEFRELLRSNTFSLMTVGMKDDETVDDAKKRLGKVISTETVLFTYGSVTYAAPPDSPARLYLDALERCERKIFRQAGLPWEGDSRDAEAAESRRIKAMDLNKSLAGMADEAERLEYRIAALWHAGEYGAEEGLRRFTDAQFIIQHPDEFFVQQASEAVADVAAALELRLGPRASALLRQQVIPIILRNVSKEDQDTINAEIDDLSDEEAARAASVPFPGEGEGQGAGQPPAPAPPVKPTPPIRPISARGSQGRGPGQGQGQGQGQKPGKTRGAVRG